MLFTLGLQLMGEALDSARVAGRVTKEDALTYRDGLIIELLAAVPLRKRTLAALTITQDLVKIGDDWLLDIPAADTKTARPLEFPLPNELSRPISLYLAHLRDMIAGANNHDGMWPSTRGRPMDKGSIYDAVRRRTTEALGFPVNLHFFRSAAGNFWSISDIGAQSRLAGRALAKVIGLHPQSNALSDSPMNGEIRVSSYRFKSGLDLFKNVLGGNCGSRPEDWLRGLAATLYRTRLHYIREAGK